MVYFNTPDHLRVLRPEQMADQEQVLPKYPPSNAKQQTKLTTAAAAEVELTEDDVPGCGTWSKTARGTKDPKTETLPSV